MPNSNDNKPTPASDKDVFDASEEILHIALEGLVGLHLDDTEILGLLISAAAGTAVAMGMTRAGFIKAALKAYDFHKHMYSFVSQITNDSPSENVPTHKRN